MTAATAMLLASSPPDWLRGGYTPVAAADAGGTLIRRARSAHTRLESLFIFLRLDAVRSPPLRCAPPKAGLIPLGSPGPKGVDRLREALELLAPGVREREAVAVQRVADLLGHQHGRGPGARREPAREVDRGAEPVAPAVHGLPPGDPGAQRREGLVLRGRLDEPQRAVEPRGPLRRPQPDGGARPPYGPPPPVARPRPPRAQ